MNRKCNMLIFGVIVWTLVMPTGLFALQQPEALQTLELIIVDVETEKPLSHVEIEVNSDGQQKIIHTDDAGHAKIPPRKLAKGYLGLLIYKESYVKKLLEWRNPSSGSDPSAITVKLEKGTSVSGKVVDDAGKPVDDATVVVNIPNRDPSRQDGIARDYVSYEAIKSDRDGNWIFNGAPKEFDNISLGVWSYRCASGEFFQFQTFDSKKARDGSIVLTLPRGFPIEGIVLDKNEKPLKGARVMYGAQMASNKMDPQPTDEEGRFYYAAEPSQSVMLTITAPGHAPELATFVMKDEAHRLKISLSESKPMFGRIVGPNEEPVPYAWVYPDTWRGSRALETRIQADKEGKFRWQDAPLDTVNCHIDGNSAGYIRIERDLVASDEEIVIQLKKSLRVSGKVVDADTGKAIEKFQVIRGTQWNLGAIQWERSRAMKSYPDGKFSYTEGWERAGYGVRIEAPGYLPDERVGFNQDSVEVAFDFELTPAENIKFAVERRDGSPVANAKAYFVPNGELITFSNGTVQYGSFLEGKTNADGKIEFPPQKEEFAIFIVCEEGYASIYPDMIAESDKVELVPWGKLEGKLILNDKPGTNETVNVVSQSVVSNKKKWFYQRIILKTDADGKFSCDRLLEETVAVSHLARTPFPIPVVRGQETTMKRVEIFEGESSSVTLEVEIEK